MFGTGFVMVCYKCKICIKYVQSVSLWILLCMFWTGFVMVSYKIKTCIKWGQNVSGHHPSFSHKPTKGRQGKKKKWAELFCTAYNNSPCAHLMLLGGRGSFLLGLTHPSMLECLTQPFSILHATYDGSSTLGPWEIPLAVLKPIRQRWASSFFSSFVVNLERNQVPLYHHVPCW